MSVQMFQGVGGNGKPNYSAVDGTALASIFVCRNIAKITVPISDQNGARRSQAIEFDSIGSSISDAISNGAEILQTILSLSAGELTYYGSQLGLWRNDQTATPVPARSVRYFSMIATNGLNSSGNVVNVAKKMSTKLYVPFLKPTVSDIAALDALTPFITAGKLGAVGFKDDNKNSFYIGIMTGHNYSATKRYQGVDSPKLVSNDTADGISTDGVLSGDPS